MEMLAQGRLQANRGVVLLLALVFMLMLAIIAATVVQRSVLQLHMSGNDQFHEENLQLALAIATELSLNPDNFFTGGEVGHINCPVAAENLGCDRKELEEPGSVQTLTGVEINYWVMRQDPLIWESYPVRESHDTESSDISFRAAIFEINVRINGRENRLGDVHIAQGIAVGVPKQHSTHAGKLYRTYWREPGTDSL